MEHSGKADLLGNLMWSGRTLLLVLEKENNRYSAKHNYHCDVKDVIERHHGGLAQQFLVYNTFCSATGKMDPAALKKTGQRTGVTLECMLKRRNMLHKARLVKLGSV